MQWQQALTIFIGTLPLLVTILWTLLQNDKRFSSVEGRLTRLESQNDKIIEMLTSIRERLATLEERERIRLH